MNQKKQIKVMKIWENYELLGAMADNGVLSKENLEKQIKAFSCFLSEKNSDYYYNKTYLPCYVEEFWDFLIAFKRKYSFVQTLFGIACRYSDVSLKIDRYWQMESFQDGETGIINNKMEVYPSYDHTLVCNSAFLIECSILRKMKRFIYQKKVENNDEEKSRAINELKKFLEKVTKESRNIG